MRSKSKAGRSGKGSCTDCRTVLYASPNHKLENFNERYRLISSTDSAPDVACLSHYIAFARR